MVAAVPERESSHVCPGVSGVPPASAPQVIVPFASVSSTNPPRQDGSCFNWSEPSESISPFANVDVAAVPVMFK